MSALWERLNPSANTLADAAQSLRAAANALSYEPPCVDEARACIALAKQQIAEAEASIDAVLADPQDAVHAGAGAP
jgi:hypothetical protein